MGSRGGLLDLRDNTSCVSPEIGGSGGSGGSDDTAIGVDLLEKQDFAR